ncbi:glycosyltransferase [Microbacterium yannicii]|uniref:glycosyltransferase n=1 Tax=Microbacterium yannicii TaxID=671622 RepID=UPI0002F1D689|nr:glycosyltransferase [Microbacterium yannicii]
MTDLAPIRSTGTARAVEPVAPPVTDAAGHHATIGCVIPAHNQEESIAQVIESLLAQTRVPDVVHVVVGNTTDATVDVASRYAGPHEVVTVLGEQYTEVFVHDIGRNPGEKAGAFNYGYTLLEGYDFLLAMDGEAVTDDRAVEYLESEAVAETRIGAMSAISWIDDAFIIFSTQALREAMEQGSRSAPWERTGEVADRAASHGGMHPVEVLHFHPSTGGRGLMRTRIASESGERR